MSFVPHHLVVAAPGSSPSRTAFVLHGILGSAKNWRSFARLLASRRPDWRFVLVDQRNHGESAPAPPPHDLESCARDLERLAGVVGGEPEIVIGHSFGGKVALVFALRAEGRIRVAWSLDSPPGARSASGDPGMEEVARVVGAVSEIPLPIRRREDLAAAFEGRGLSPALAAWMTTNLEAAPGGYSWRFDLEGVREMLSSYLAADLWPALASPPPGLEVHLLRAGRASRWPVDDLRRFAALDPGGPVRAHVLPDSGHWVHADDPEGLAALLDETLDRPPA